MQDDHKAAGRVEIKSADRGEFSAIIATFNAIDSDGDVVRRDAFTEGEDVVVSAYGHRSWDGILPVGHAKIRTTDREAIADGAFLMNTTGGRDTFEVVKGLAERGLGEWSWGFHVEDSERGMFEGKSVRFINKVRTFEVSPVLRGAGVGTRTLATKSAGDPQAIFIAELMRFVGTKLARDIRDEMDDIRHSIEMAQLRDQPRAEIADIRDRWAR